MVNAVAIRIKACGAKLIVVLLTVLLSAGAANAKVEIVEFENSSQKELYQTLIHQLRCLVCQNQNLADSNADLAVDLRRKVRVLINDGKEYDDIVDYMVSRYGEFVMYRPQFNTSTLFLWLSPACSAGCYLFDCYYQAAAVNHCGSIQQSAISMRHSMRTCVLCFLGIVVSESRYA